MMAGDRGIIHLQQVVGQAPDRDHALRQGDLFQHCGFKLQIEFCHFGLPPPEKTFESNCLYHGWRTIRTSTQVTLSSPPSCLAASISRSQAESSVGADVRMCCNFSSFTSLVKPSVARSS